jgi:hypothetical protein
LFTGFLPSQGFLPGTYDLSDPERKNLVVTFEVSGQGEVPVGQPEPYSRYSSSMTVDGAGSTYDSTPAAGASGKVTVAQYKPSQVVPSAAYDITLLNVVLPVLVKGGQNNTFPSTVTIQSAHIVSRQEN